MAKNGNWHYQDKPGVSRGTLDGYTRLGAKVCVSAARDLHSCDFIEALDAFLWWLDEGAIWLYLVMGYDLPGQDVLRLVLGVGENGKETPLQLVGRSTKAY